MSKIRYEQTLDTSHISHVHDGANGVRLKYDVALHSHPRTLNNAREAKIRIMGTYGSMLASQNGASTATYFCDYELNNHGETQFTSSLRWVAFGGDSNEEFAGGLFCLRTDQVWMNKGSGSYCGSRLCFFKQI